jgi:adenosylhomocysteine nucleosidase
VSSIGLIVALAQECRSLTSRKVPEGRSHRLDDGRLLVRAGAGPDAARKAAGLLLELGATALVSWGCAAGLDPRLQPGDLVIPAAIRQPDGALLRTDPVAVQALLDRLLPTLNPIVDTLLETPVIVGMADEKERLFRDSGAVAADMESAAVARVAAERGVPFLAVRSVADPAAMSLPPSIAAAFDDQGRLHLNRLFRSLLLRPGDIPGLIGVGRHFRLALATLSRVNALAGTDLFGPGGDSARRCPAS